MDETSFTTYNELLNLQVAQQFNKMAPPTRGEVREFYAIALTDAVPISHEAQKKFFADEAFGVVPVSAGLNAMTARILVKAKIISDMADEPLPPEGNPHAKLDDPCAYDSTDPSYVMALILNYTTFISSKDFSMSPDDITIRKNDKIRVLITINDDGTLNMQRGEIVALSSRAPEEYKGLTDCTSLISMFE